MHYNINLNITKYAKEQQIMSTYSVVTSKYDTDLENCLKLIVNSVDS